MKAGDWERLKDLFEAVLERPAAERDRFIDLSCEGNVELTAELRRLLDAHGEAGSFLSSPAVAAPAPLSKDLPPRYSPQTVLAGRFQIVRFIARGGMGEVYEAEDLALEERVALKTIRPDLAADDRALALFKQEMQLARHVTHPNVCRLFEFGIHVETDENGRKQEVHFLTMELLEGQSLSHRLKKAEPFAPSQAVKLIEQIASALDAAHEAGVIHRDFKPGNVMLVRRGQNGELRPIVTDFGMAFAAVPSRKTGSAVSDTRGGTPGYMAPEQVHGGSITTATDVYSFAMVIAEMVGGNGRDGTTSRWWSLLNAVGVPAPTDLRVPASCAGWKPVLQRCLEVRPERRYQHPGEVAAALKAALDRRNRAAMWRLAVPAAALAASILALQPFVSERYRVATLVERTYRRLHPAPVLDFQKRNWVLITRFENGTDEKLLDGTLEYALERDLSESRYVSVVSRARVEDALRLMQKPPVTVLDRETGRQVCVRDGGIRVMLAGRAEKISGRYRLILEVVDPYTGSTALSRQEDADGEQGLLSAVHRLSSWTRARLGEAVTAVSENGQHLEKVTSPSLRAAQLYSAADRAVRNGRNREAESLLKEALATDPQFASAENLLAWALVNSGRPQAEWVPHAERAYRLSDRVSEQEQYFIRGTYYQFQGNFEEARKQYETLVHLYPDHFWGNGNLSTVSATLGQFEEVFQSYKRMAEAQPLNTGIQILTGDVALRVLGNIDEARRAADRVLQALPEDGRGPTSGSGWVDMLPAHIHWQAGRIDEAHQEAVRLAGLVDTLLGDKRHEYTAGIGDFFLALGELRRAEESYRKISMNPGGRGWKPWEPAILAFAREDKQALRERMEWFMDVPNPFDANEFPIMYMIRAGMTERALDAIRKRKDPVGGAREWRTARGEIALQQGNTKEAIRLLREALSFQGNRGFPTYFMGSESLARALEKEGRYEEAIAVLESASRDKLRATALLYGHTGLYWLRIQEQLARLCRKTGRLVEAAAAEEDLLNTLSHADPDHPILLRVLQAHRKAAASK